MTLEEIAHEIKRQTPKIPRIDISYFYHEPPLESEGMFRFYYRDHVGKTASWHSALLEIVRTQNDPMSIIEYYVKKMTYLTNLTQEEVNKIESFRRWHESQGTE